MPPFQIVERKKKKRRATKLDDSGGGIRRRQDTLSAARLIDNAVEISFARANLGSQMRRLRARCKRNRPFPRRDGANLLPLGMKADLSTSFDRLLLSPCTLSRTPSPFSSFPPFCPRVSRAGINTRCSLFAFSLSLCLHPCFPFFRSEPSRYSLPLAAIRIVSSPCFECCKHKRGVPIDLSNPSQAPDSELDPRTRGLDNKGVERKKKERERKKGRSKNETRRNKRAEGRR